MEIRQGDVAVITGGAGGIGSGLAELLAKRGCALVLADISQEALEKTKQSLNFSEQKISLHQIDVTDKVQMERLASEVIAEHGKVNILINNAGITYQKNFSTHTIEDWEKIIGINLWGVIYGLHYFDEHLRAADRLMSSICRL